MVCLPAPTLRLHRVSNNLSLLSSPRFWEKASALKMNEPQIQQKSNLNSIKLTIVLLIGFMLALTIGGAFFSSGSYANDQIRVMDISLIQKFLIAYKQNQGSYPLSIQGLPQGPDKYLSSFPTPPVTASNCSSAQNQYQYTTINNGQSYNLSFCLGRSVSGFHVGINTLTSN